MRPFVTPLWIIAAALLATSCSSLPQAQLEAGDDPQQAVAEVSGIMTRAQQDQIDVLADRQYAKGRIYLADARRALQAGAPADKVLQYAAIAKAFFQEARESAEPRRETAPRILEARASALGAGVRKSEALVDRLAEIDDDLKSETKQFSRVLPPEEFAELQKQYLTLETRAVQYSELNNVNEAIEQAIDDDAEDRAPETLRRAQLDYKTAMNMIAQSPRSPELYKKSVDEALASATLLVDVMNVIKGAKGTPEHIALQIVEQKRELGQLSTNLKTAEQRLQEKEGELQRTESELKNQEQQLARASMQVRFQRAMDEARKQLSEDDALVYQQGNQLVFRLKRVHFPSGTARIPEFSKLLIQKVDAIIKKLDAKKVVVQGHTDSVGSREVNKKLSIERAKAVADYLYSLGGGYTIGYTGFGETHPIASNETSAGRATNRRVDLVVSVKQ